MKIRLPVSILSVFLMLQMMHPVDAAPVDPSLLNALRQGGYILYVRHGDASVGTDRPSIDFNDCSTQRILSEAGRSQSARFGNALRNLHVPVQIPVMASPFCRTKETAELAFGTGNVLTDPFWLQVYALRGTLPPAQQEVILKALTSILETPPSPGMNKVIIAHSFPPGIGLGTIESLGTVVIKPKGRGNGYEVAGRFQLNELPSS